MKTLELPQSGVNSLASVVLPNCHALYTLMAQQGGAYVFIGEKCCFCVFFFFFGLIQSQDQEAGLKGYGKMCFSLLFSVCSSSFQSMVPLQIYYHLATNPNLPQQPVQLLKYVKLPGKFQRKDLLVGFRMNVLRIYHFAMESS